jgi:NADH-quinone oxidoreductase subunit F
LNDKNLDTNTKNFFENLDEGYLSAECNIGEEEIEDLNALYIKSKKPMLVVGHDLYNHPRAQNLAKLISLLVRYGNFKIFHKI